MRKEEGKRFRQEVSWWWLLLSIFVLVMAVWRTLFLQQQEAFFFVHLTLGIIYWLIFGVALLPSMIVSYCEVGRDCLCIRHGIMKTTIPYRAITMIWHAGDGVTSSRIIRIEYQVSEGDPLYARVAPKDQPGFIEEFERHRTETKIKSHKKL